MKGYHSEAESTALADPLGPAFRHGAMRRFQTEWVESTVRDFTGLVPFPGKANGDTVVSIVFEWQPDETVLRKQWRPTRQSITSPEEYLKYLEEIGEELDLPSVAQELGRLCLHSQNRDESRDGDLKPHSTWFTLWSEFRHPDAASDYLGRTLNTAYRAPCATDPNRDLVIDWLAVWREYLETDVWAPDYVDPKLAAAFLSARRMCVHKPWTKLARAHWARLHPVRQTQMSHMCPIDRVEFFPLFSYAWTREWDEDPYAEVPAGEPFLLASIVGSERTYGLEGYAKVGIGGDDV